MEESYKFVNPDRVLSDLNCCLTISVHSCDNCHYKHISSPRCKVELLRDCQRAIRKLKGEKNNDTKV